MPKPKLTPTNIDWTDFVWNPMSGCSKISSGCHNCYAADMAKRLQRIQETTGKDLGYADGFAVTLHPERLEAPLNHKKPAKIFVNSMGDLFHESVHDTYIFSVFFKMMDSPQHTFQILTKRPERMREFINKFLATPNKEVLKNVWLGVTAENQEQANERIPVLLDTPAAVRFVSIEPMLEEIDLDGHITWGGSYYGYKCKDCGKSGNSKAMGSCEDDIWCPECGSRNIDDLPEIDWVIVGGETGKNARPMDASWAQNIQKQCEAAKVPFFFKQWGEFIEEHQITNPGYQMYGGTYSRWSNGDLNFFKCGKKRAGHMLDGKEYREYPDAK